MTKYAVTLLDSNNAPIGHARSRIASPETIAQIASDLLANAQRSHRARSRYAGHGSTKPVRVVAVDTATGEEVV